MRIALNKIIFFRFLHAAAKKGDDDNEGFKNPGKDDICKKDNGWNTLKKEDVAVAVLSTKPPVSKALMILAFLGVHYWQQLFSQVNLCSL